VVPPAGAARNAYVSDHAGDAPARNKDAKALSPYRVELVQKALVGRDVAKLAAMVGVGLQRTVGRAGANQMHALGRNHREVAGVGLVDDVLGQAVEFRFQHSICPGVGFLFYYSKVCLYSSHRSTSRTCWFLPG
jgi:hypothetical protein